MANIAILLLIVLSFSACKQSKTETNMSDTTKKFNPLTPEEEKVIVNKETEIPFTGKYLHYKEDGTYTCKRCNAALYKSSDKFESGCGWPSFDDEIPGSVKKIPDADGTRTEILCNNCGGHLGHIFLGEGFTAKNTRHCVNSISLNFIPDTGEVKTDTAIFAGGCFWGVEYYFMNAPGVLKCSSGYIGGNKENPSYKDVCSGTTGHAEAVEVVFDVSKTNFETLAKLFFEIHDFTQIGRQGPDIGEQYRSEIFFKNQEQKEISEKLIAKLKDMSYNVATKITDAKKFWKAEDYHQEYYKLKGGMPYCHAYKKIF